VTDWKQKPKPESVHDSVNNPRLRSSSSSLGLDLAVATNFPTRYYRVRLVP
jgi:hypothetical protein